MKLVTILKEEAILSIKEKGSYRERVVVDHSPEVYKVLRKRITLRNAFNPIFAMESNYKGKKGRMDLAIKVKTLFGVEDKYLDNSYFVELEIPNELLDKCLLDKFDYDKFVDLCYSEALERKLHSKLEMDKMFEIDENTEEVSYSLPYIKKEFITSVYKIKATSFLSKLIEKYYNRKNKYKDAYVVEFGKPILALKKISINN